MDENGPNGSPFTGEPVGVVELINGARHGESWAWNGIVERFLPLVRATARGYRLNESDTEDVGQTVWLRLVENLERIREPRALPAWLITTTRNESLRLARAHRRTLPVDPLDEPTLDIEPDTTPEPDSDILRVEVAQVLREGLADLTSVQRTLLELLTGEQSLSYREISELLTIPLGSIGPTRARGLARLRTLPVVRDYLFDGCDDSCPQARTA
jgi:RNA polymerase sigma factor (sigma-70 family)